MRRRAAELRWLDAALDAERPSGHHKEHADMLARTAKAAASILGDEAMHWAVLRQALGEAPVPGAFMS